LYLNFKKLTNTYRTYTCVRGSQPTERSVFVDSKKTPGCVVGTPAFDLVLKIHERLFSTVIVFLSAFARSCTLEKQNAGDYNKNAMAPRDVKYCSKQERPEVTAENKLNRPCL